MRRPIWIGAAILVVIAAAIPLWIVLVESNSDGRRPAALQEEEALDCGAAKDPEACAKLQRLLDKLRHDLTTLDGQLRRAEETLAAAEDNSQPANVDLQNILQRQAETFQTMSTISTVLSDASGDDAQLANVDLQNILQKQQQLLQMMSNISKMLADTAQGVIRKFGG